MKNMLFAPKRLVLCLGMSVMLGIVLSYTETGAKDTAINAGLGQAQKQHHAVFVDNLKERLRSAPPAVTGPGLRALDAFNGGDLEKAHSLILKATLDHPFKASVQEQYPEGNVLLAIRDDISFHYLKDLVKHNKLPKNILSPRLAIMHLDERGYRSDMLDVYCHPNDVQDQGKRNKQCADALPLNDVQHYLDRLARK